MARFKNWQSLRRAVLCVLLGVAVHWGWSQFTLTMNRAVSDAVDAGKVEQGMTLARWGGDVNTSGTNGTTLLMLACAQGRRERARSLLSMGAEVQARDAQGWTPLLHAA